MSGKSFEKVATLVKEETNEENIKKMLKKIIGEVKRWLMQNKKLPKQILKHQIDIITINILFFDLYEEGPITIITNIECNKSKKFHQIEHFAPKGVVKND
jgi:hypothetical protein